MRTVMRQKRLTPMLSSSASIMVGFRVQFQLVPWKGSFGVLGRARVGHRSAWWCLRIRQHQVKKTTKIVYKLNKFQISSTLTQNPTEIEKEVTKMHLSTNCWNKPPQGWPGRQFRQSLRVELFLKIVTSLRKRQDNFYGRNKYIISKNFPIYHIFELFILGEELCKETVYRQSSGL